jgi:hypothetical protein
MKKHLLAILALLENTTASAGVDRQELHELRAKIEAEKEPAAPKAKKG